MYIVKWKVGESHNSQECKDLDEAMLFAKRVNQFVTIIGDSIELVGFFGVDSVNNGVCPDGVEYSWKKRR